MRSIQSGFVSGVSACLLVAFGCLLACGSSTSSSDGAGGAASSGGGASQAGRGGQAGHAGKGSSGGGEAGSPDGSGGSELGNEAGAAGSGEGGAAGEGGEAGASTTINECTVASFQSACPEKACSLVSGCMDGKCQYTPVAVCVSRLGIGTFAPGAADVTVGDVSLHGNIGAFRFSDGAVCKSTTCVTGGLTP